MLIFHISDIHIRLFSRHREYEEVFEELYHQLDSTTEQKKIVVITGDILHTKVELTPECILVTLRFFQELAKRCPTYVIPGNHDALLNNRERMDSLTAVLRDRPIPNLFYLRDTGIYPVVEGELSFHVVSLLDPLSDSAEETATWYRDSLAQSTADHRIALFHGGVGRYRLQNNFMQQSNIPLSVFDGYDAVLLGDIHLHQFLSPTIAYAGSLVAQNAGETDPNHGILVWNVSTAQPIQTEYRVLKNRWAYTEIVVESCQDKLPTGCVWKGIRVAAWEDLVGMDFPEKGRVRVRFVKEHQQTTTTVSPTPDQVREITTIFTRRFPGAVLSFPPVGYQAPTTEEEQDAVETSTTNNNNGSQIMRAWIHQPETFLMEYLKDLKSTGGVPEGVNIPEDFLGTFRDRCMEAFRLRESADEHQSRWRILRMEWDHMFGYGANQSIDFLDLKKRGTDTIGVFGANSSGKSTIIDILCFLLFNKITRWANKNSIPAEVVHIRSKKATGSVWIEVGGNGTRYRIQKVFTRGKHDKITMKEEVFEVDKITGKDIRAVHGEQRRQTDLFLRKQIGDFEEFIFLSVFLQRDKTSFRDMTQKERKESFFRHFHLDFLESTRMCEAYETELRDLVAKSAHLEERASSSQEMDFPSLREQLVEKKKEMDRRLDKMSEDRVPWESESQTILSNIHAAKEKMANETSLQSQLKEIENTLQRYRSSKEKLLQKLVGKEDLLTTTTTTTTTTTEDDDSWKEERLRLQAFLTHRDARDRAPLPFQCRFQAEWIPLFVSRGWMILPCPGADDAMICSQHTTTDTSSSCHDPREEIIRMVMKKEFEGITTLSGWEKKAMAMIRGRPVSTLWDFPTDIITTTTDEVVMVDYEKSQKEIEEVMGAVETEFRTQLEPQWESILRQNAQRKSHEEDTTLMRTVQYNPTCSDCQQNPFRQKALDQTRHLEEMVDKARKDTELFVKRIGNLIELMDSVLTRLDTSTITTTTTTTKSSSSGIRNRLARWAQEVNVKGVGELEEKYRELWRRRDAVEQCRVAQENRQYWNDLVVLRETIVLGMYGEYRKACEDNENHWQEHQQQMEKHLAYRREWEDTHVQYKALERRREVEEAQDVQEQIVDMEKRVEQENRKRAQVLADQKEVLRCRAEIDGHERQYRQVKEHLKHLQEEQVAAEVEKRSLERREEEMDRMEKNLANDRDRLREMRGRRLFLEFLIKKVFHRDGFPIFMLRRFIKEFECRLEMILEPFLHGKRLQLHIEEDSSIRLTIQNSDGTRMPNLFLGGMEGLMVDVGMKVVLNMISTEPRSNVFILDENISVLDQDHLQNLRQIFDLLIQHFDHILIISHLDIVKDFVSGCILTSRNMETNQRSLQIVS